MGSTDTEALVAADKAATEAKANGGGDISIFNAQRDALELRRTADVMIAAEIRDSELKLATIYDNSGRKGTATRKRENANRDYKVAVKAATDDYFARLAMFAVSGGFTSMVPADQMASAAAAAIRKQLAPVVTMLQNLQSAKIETVDLGSGIVWNVSERLSSLEPAGIVPSDTDTPTDPGNVPEPTATE